MIERSDLTRRIAIATRWTTILDGRIAGTQHQLAAIHRAGLDMRHIDNTRVIVAAWAHIHDHLPGYPTTSMPTRGSRGTTSNRTLNLAVPEDDRIDPVRRDVDELLELLERATTTAQACAEHRDVRAVARTGNSDAAEVLEGSALRIRFLLLRWAKEPDVRWCTSCARDGGHRQPIDVSRFGDLCRWCGEFRRSNKKLPPVELLHYRHAGERIPQKVLDRHHVKLPKRKKATT